MASALLQQRMGAQGQNQNMDLMFRRDPRAATALIQSQMAAQEEAANRAQRGDIANQEMQYRNDSLNAQTQAGADDRKAAMDRLAAQLLGQKGLSTERMNFETTQADAARQAAIAEAAAQREFQRGQTGSQQKFQGTLADKQMKHATESESRQAMLNTMLKGMEISGLDKRSQDDMRTKMMAAYANLAESAADPNYPTAKAALDNAFAGMNAQMSGAPAPKPQEPATAEGRFAAKYPELKTSWDAALMGKDGVTKKSMADFLKSIAIEDINNNRDPLKAYLGLRYQGQSPDSELSNSWSLNPNTTAKTDVVRQAMGLEPTGNWWQDARKIGFNPLLPGADATGAAMEWLSKLVK